MESLSAAELARLSEFEGLIERSVQSWVSIGIALQAIRDEKLYRATHGTFEDYCRGRWRIGRQRAYELMRGLAVVENVRNCVHGQRLTESQVRSLTRLSPEQQVDAVERAVEQAPKRNDGTPKLTAKLLAAAADEVLVAWDEPVPGNVVKFPTRRSVTLKAGQPEVSAAALIAAWSEYDVIKFFSELSYTLHMTGKLSRWVEHFEELIARARANEARAGN